MSINTENHQITGHHFTEIPQPDKCQSLIMKYVSQIDPQAS